MPIDDDDDDTSNLDAIVEPPQGSDIPVAHAAGTVAPARTIHEPIPPLREVRARLVKLPDSETTSETDAADRNAILLEDPEGFAAQPAVLSTWAYTLALLFDGRRSAVEAASTFREKYGQSILPEQALTLQNELEQAFFLNSSTFEDGLRQRLNAYLDMPTWPASHAGGSYPADPIVLKETIEGFFSAPGGPGKLGDAPQEPPVLLNGNAALALIVPHIDLRVGGPTYAHAYKELMNGSAADLIFVLGVAHQFTGEHIFSVSQKDYDTPLGKLANAREISKRLHAASGAEDVVAEMAHRGEFSIEFQAMLLKVLLAERCKRNIEIVPILCGSVDSYLAREVSPFKDAEFLRFTAALRKELDTCGRKWCVLCSVDLSHVGPEFGHSSMIDERLLKPIERMDRKMLATLEKIDPEAFFNEIARTQNSRHVDAVMSVLTMLQACRGMLKHAKLLHYDQMLKAPSHSAVSYAAMSFEGTEAPAPAEPEQSSAVAPEAPPEKPAEEKQPASEVNEAVAPS